MILLLDTTGHVVRSFTSYTQANNFRTAMNYSKKPLTITDMDTKKLNDTQHLIIKLGSFIKKHPNAYGIHCLTEIVDSAILFVDREKAKLAEEYVGKQCIAPPSRFSLEGVSHTAEITGIVDFCEDDVIVRVAYTDHTGWDTKRLSKLTIQ